jgi:hypothetical protein
MAEPGAGKGNMMKRTIRTGITGALLVGGVACLAVLGSVRPGSTPAPPAANDFSISRSEGDVIITTDPSGAVGIAFDADADGPATPVPAATISVTRKCVVRISNSPISVNIVGFAGGGETALPSNSPGELGLVNNGLGSSDGKNCNTSNGLVESGQAIAIGLSQNKIDQGSSFLGRTGSATRCGASWSWPATRSRSVCSPRWSSRYPSP